MNKLIFFDLDGTLISPKKRYCAIHKFLCKIIDVTPVSCNEYWELKRNKVTENEILIQCGAKEKNIEVALKARSEMLEDKNYLLYDTLFEGVIEILEYLYKDFILVLVTYRRQRRELEEQLKNIKIINYFDKVLSTTPVIQPKYMGKVNLIEHNYGGSLDGIYFGDTEVDILAGKHLNLTTVAYMNGIRKMNFLKKINPDFSINSWDVNCWDKGLTGMVKN